MPSPLRPALALAVLSLAPTDGVLAGPPSPAALAAWETYAAATERRIEHSVDYRVFGPDRAASRSIGTKVAELADAGTIKEREIPLDHDIVQTARAIGISFGGN